MHSFKTDRSSTDFSTQLLDLGLGNSPRARIDLRWTGESDLDLHAIVCRSNPGHKPVLTNALDVLSVYNVVRQIGNDEPGLLHAAPDGSFSILDGALTHSPVTRQLSIGTSHEWIELDPSRWTSDTGFEIILIAMMHPQTGSLTFKDAGDVELSISCASGEILLRSQLDLGFDDCFGVHIGTVLIKPAAAPAYMKVGAPLYSDFNKTLELFA